jgi:cobalt-precorrin-5B (C1)-methyltransferase
MTKLGQGLLDLHSKRGEVDLSWLTARCAEAGASDALITRVKAARSAGEVLELARAEGFDIAAPVAKAAWDTAARALHGSSISLEIAVFDREGHLLARTPFWPVH